MKSTKWRALERGVLHLSKGQIGQKQQQRELCHHHHSVAAGLQVPPLTAAVVSLTQGPLATQQLLIQTARLEMGNINSRKMTTDCFTSNDIKWFGSDIDRELGETTINSPILPFPLPSIWRKLSPRRQRSSHSVHRALAFAVTEKQELLCAMSPENRQFRASLYVSSNSQWSVVCGHLLDSVPVAQNPLITRKYTGFSTDEAMMLTYLLALSLCLQESSKQNEVSLTMTCLIAH
ncbi:hypothetical protein HGM15179_008250 [Zosterops borbonicus]|uniref:Uncharacterized protein n=1 Tax=Zosterops borbonicus TaxID=364589 RepID=A0A8K1LM88_9PASS|nr:hypothetical protein HGM15179_008250 [Zosterops borbonicus]